MEKKLGIFAVQITVGCTCNRPLGETYALMPLGFARYKYIICIVKQDPLQCSWSGSNEARGCGYPQALQQNARDIYELESARWLLKQYLRHIQQLWLCYFGHANSKFRIKYRNALNVLSNANCEILARGNQQQFRFVVLSISETKLAKQRNPRMNYRQIIQMFFIEHCICICRSFKV